MVKFGKLIVALILIAVPVTVLAAELNADRIFDLVNLERERADIGPLKRNRFLDAAANAKARDLIYKQFFAHTGPDGNPFTSWVDTGAYPYTALGENLAMDFSSERGVIRGWLGSASHKTNLLDPIWKDAGVASASGTINLRFTNVIVQIFGVLTPLSDIEKPQLASGSVAGTRSTNNPLVTGSTTALAVIAAASALLSISFLSYARVHPRVAYTLDHHAPPRRRII